MLENDLLKLINTHAGEITQNDLLRHYANLNYNILLDTDILTLSKDTRDYKNYFKAQGEIVEILKTWDKAGFIHRNNGKLILTDKARDLIKDLEVKTFNSADITGFFDGKIFKPKRLADHITQEYTFKTLLGSEEVYYYENGLYVKNGHQKIKAISTNLLKDEYTNKRYAEVLSYIQGQTYIKPDDLNNEWLNLENGLLNPITREFKPHTPDIFSIVRIPIKYDPKAECPLWIEKLSGKVSEETFKTVQEFFGYCYLPGQIYEKGFLLYGPKRTMKSTTLYVLEQLLGKENYVSFSLQNLSNDPFVMAYLFGKLANICADITSQALRETGPFLKITGGDPISAGKKNQHPITFYPDTKLIFSCNVIPATYNKNPAFYRRWIPLNFDKQTPKAEVDPKLKEKLKAELPGILNWALDGLKRLEENKGFSYTLSDDEIRDLYERNSDTISSFIFNRIDTENDEGSLTKRETFKAYLEYCKENKLQPENVIKFGKFFIALTGCGTGHKGPAGSSIPAYKGVNWKLKDDSKDTLLGFSNTDSIDEQDDNL